MDTAARRFAADGFHATSVTSIVESIGVGKGVFYWYFTSKDELFGEILTGALRSMRLAQRDAIAGEPDPARRIEWGIRASLRLALRPPPPLPPDGVRPHRGAVRPDHAER